MRASMTGWSKLAVAILLLLGLDGVGGIALAAELDEAARYVAHVEQAKGHLMASREVYRRGQAVRAGVHASHPSQELGYRLWRPIGRVDPELGARVQAAVKAPGLALAAKAPAPSFEAAVDRALGLLDQAVSAVVPARLRTDPRVQARVIRDLLLAIDEEYGEAIAQGRVVLEIEYQDAWGFFQRLRELWSGLRTQLAASASASGPVVDEQMAILATAFARIDTPSAPMEVERVQAALDRIGQALAPVAAGPGRARAVPRAP